MPWIVRGPTRHLARYREIATTLTRHGLGWLVIQLGMAERIPFERGLLGHEPREEPYSKAEHLHLALAELGPTFIKLGQVLSTRADLLPPEYIAELVKLQDAAPPVAYADVVAVIQEELGAKPEEIFSFFNPVPRASASLGQAHAARLQDGTPVIVKVQRPGVERLVTRDLSVLEEIARQLSSRTGVSDAYDLPGIVEEFSYALRDELDYNREGQNADRLRQYFREEPALYVPRIYWDFTARRVLTIEEIAGIKINDFAGLDAAGIERQQLARVSAHIILREVFEFGFFHADPHPGNFFVMNNADVAARRHSDAVRSASVAAGSERSPVIGLIDFGMVGRLSSPVRTSLLRLALALSMQDTERMVDELLALGASPGRVDRVLLKRDLDRFLVRNSDKSLREMAASRVFNDVMDVARRHHLQLPTDLTLLVKVFAMSEGIGAQLDPDFQFLAFAEPYFRRFWLEGHTPALLAGKIVAGIQDVAELGLDLPHQLRRLLQDLERGNLVVTSRYENAEHAQAELNRLVNRLAISILTSALIISLALLMLVYHPAGWDKWGGWFFSLSFVVAMLLGLRLLWTISHSK